MANDPAAPRVGDHVSFRVRDIYLPGPIEFLGKINLETEILGAVLGFSDSGPKPSVFAVVRTDEQNHVIVPVASLSRVRREGE
jgi:hypothetical protein